MTGNRKMTGFYWATICLLIVAILVIFKSPADTDFVELFKYYSIFQGSITAGFFGFNFGEHWTKNRVNKNEK